MEWLACGGRPPKQHGAGFTYIDKPRKHLLVDPCPNRDIVARRARVELFVPAGEGW